MSGGHVPHLAVALDGAGWHPAAWREPDARPEGLFGARYWADLVLEAESGLLDFVTIDDRLALQSSLPYAPDNRVDQVRGRLDAVLVAARVAPLTSHIGLVPVATVTHTEPFHISKALATLDYVSSGRAGWQARVSRGSLEAAHFGRRAIPGTSHGTSHGTSPDATPGASPGASPDNGQYPGSVQDLALLDEAADFIEVVRRLWDSWEDHAEIRDVATGRFVDRAKLHYIDFEGRWFKVKGPSITPRPPQGQPVVTALAHATAAYRLAARGTDLVYVTPLDAEHARRITGEVRQLEAELRTMSDPIRILADLVVFLDDDGPSAKARKAHLDALDGTEYTSDAAVFVGTPSQLAERLLAWSDAGLDGFRLRPGALPHDLVAITRGLVPLLQSAGAFRRGYGSTTLRAHLGLGRPANRYASV